MGSRGSVHFLESKNKKFLPITHKEMTRFMITLGRWYKFSFKAFEDMIGGEIYVKKIPSMKVIDIARAINDKARLKIIELDQVKRFTNK